MFVFSSEVSLSAFLTLSLHILSQPSCTILTFFFLYLTSKQVFSNCKQNRTEHGLVDGAHRRYHLTWSAQRSAVPQLRPDFYIQRKGLWVRWGKSASNRTPSVTIQLFLNPLVPELFFFLILAHCVYKMWLIQEPNKLALWNKLHFEEKKKGEYRACLKYSVPIFVE